jgi:hypothetical protein
MNFGKFKRENKLKKLEKAMGQFWPTAAALTVGGLPWLSGPKDETGLLGRPTNLAHGSMPDVVTAPTQLTAEQPVASLRGPR